MIELPSCWALRSFPVSNMPEITGNNPQAQPAFHPLLPVVGTFAPAIIASQTRDAALNACPPAIASLPAASILSCQRCLRKLAHPGDRNLLYSSGFTDTLRFG